MQYFISFLEGIITFISPCLLPMLPIYISYFAGSASSDQSVSMERSRTVRTLKYAVSFVLGFSVLFVAMGALAGTLGSFLKSHQSAVNIITGLIVIFFGLNYIGIFRLNIFKGIKRNVNTGNMSMLSAFLFGVVFSIGWTPCVGAFLGSALMLASWQGHAAEGMLMLLTYSLGLGIPFILSALLIEKLSSAFSFIKKHYAVINTVCGIFLIFIGLLMMSGIMGRFLALLS